MPEQFGLFSELSEPAPEAIRPAERVPTHQEVAARLPPNLRIGTSSWSFPGWTGLVWDRRYDASSLSKRGLEAYAAHPLLNAVGLDRSFYAPVPLNDLRSYAEQTPDDFRFLVKAPQAVTQSWLKDSPEPNPAFLDSTLVSHQWIEPTAIGLGNKLGVFLFQFPPLSDTFTREPRRFHDALDAFLSQLPRGARYAIELRDRVLMDSTYRGILQEHQVSHCYNVHPKMPGLLEQAQLLVPSEQPLFVCRWMLHSGMRYEQARDRYAPFDKIVDPDPISLESISDLLGEVSNVGKPSIIIVNNKAEGSSPLSVFRLARAIAGV